MVKVNLTNPDRQPVSGARPHRVEILAPYTNLGDNFIMRRRPWALIILAVLHFLAPIGNVIFNALITGREVLSYLVYALSPEYFSTNWVILLAPIVAGIAVYACKRWSFFVYLLAITSLFIFSYSGYQSKAGAITFIPVLLVYLVNVAVVSYFLLPAVRSVYFDRRMRWWEIQARYKCDLKCEWSLSTESKVTAGRVGNISRNGLFLRADEMPPDQSEVSILLPFNDGNDLQVRGDAIIHNRVDAVGFGVKFNHTKESRSKVNQLIDDLEARGMRISTLDGRPEDSFSYWLRTLLTTGKGLIPKKENTKG